MDESGSRIHITNIVVPKQVLELEKKLEEIKELKNEVVKSQKYEEAAKLRDDEKRTEKELDHAQLEWEEHSKLHKEIVTEDNVAEVVSMMTGIPVNRIAEAESKTIKRSAKINKRKINWSGSSSCKSSKSNSDEIGLV